MRPGWLILAATVLVIGALVIGLFAWLDRTTTEERPWSVSDLRASQPDPANPRLFQLKSTSRSFPILINTGNCYDDGEVSIERIDVEESETSVVITSHIRRPAILGQRDDCLTALRGHVRLDRPLGDRDLLDGSVDPPSPPRDEL